MTEGVATRSVCPSWCVATYDDSAHHEHASVPLGLLTGTEDDVELIVSMGQLDDADPDEVSPPVTVRLDIAKTAFDGWRLETRLSVTEARELAARLTEAADAAEVATVGEPSNPASP